MCARFSTAADTRHVLKFCKDPFRGIDEIGSKKEHLVKRRCRHLANASNTVVVRDVTARTPHATIHELKPRDYGSD